MEQVSAYALRDEPCLSEYDSDQNPPFIRIWKQEVIVPDALRKCVFFIGSKEGGKFKPYGTAFVVTYQQEGLDFYHAVTAEHVVRKLILADKPIYGRANLEGDDVVEFRITSDAWQYYPEDDPLSDVAVVPFQSAVQIEEKLVPLDFRAVPINGPRSMAATTEKLEELKSGIGEEIAIVGLFRSHYGKERNFPIVRIGNIAAMREELVSTANGFMDVYLIEARSIGGLSGSPVFVSFPPIREVDGALKTHPGGPLGGRFLLLGLVHGHFDIRNLHDDTATDVHDAQENSGGSINSGIGIVIPIEKIIATIECDDLTAKRTQKIKEYREASGAVPAR